MKQEWYFSRTRGLYRLSADELGMAKLVWTDLFMQMTTGFLEGFQFADRNTEAFGAALRKAIPDIQPLKDLAHHPVIYTERGWIDEKSGVEEDVGPRIWSVGGSESFWRWEDVIAHGREILACDIPAGTLLMGNTRRLMQVAYGDLSVRGDFFLGCWQEAVRVRAAELRASPRHRDGESEYVLAVYCGDERIDSARDQYRLAVEFLGSSVAAMEWLWSRWRFGSRPDGAQFFLETCLNEKTDDLDSAIAAVEDFVSGHPQGTAVLQSLLV